MESKLAMVVAFIPVRGGSKSIPLKNIKPFCGKPLVYWNLLALEQTDGISDIVVATDSDEIESTVMSFGFSKVRIYRRRPENATDTASTESVMLEYLTLKQYSSGDVLVLVQATSPLTSSNDFRQALKAYSLCDCDSMLSCIKTKRFFWNMDGTPLNYDYRSRPRRQEFDGLLMENGAFYINRVENILRDGNRLSGRIGIYEMPEYSGIEIDEEDDWIIAESMMRNHLAYLFSRKPVSIKLFLSDVDGTLTDAGMYYDQHGNESKKFSTRDGKGFELLRQQGIKTGFLTSETSAIVEYRAKKLKIDFLIQGVGGKEKLLAAKDLAKQLNIDLNEVAYIGDDINCLELLETVGYAGCPADAESIIRKIPGIRITTAAGGHGAVREFINRLLEPLSI